VRLLFAVHDRSMPTPPQHAPPHAPPHAQPHAQPAPAAWTSQGLIGSPCAQLLRHLYPIISQRRMSSAHLNALTTKSRGPSLAPYISISRHALQTEPMLPPPMSMKITLKPPPHSSAIARSVDTSAASTDSNRCPKQPGGARSFWVSSGRHVRTLVDAHGHLRHVVHQHRGAALVTPDLQDHVIAAQVLGDRRTVVVNVLRDHDRRTVARARRAACGRGGGVDEQPTHRVQGLSQHGPFPTLHRWQAHGQTGRPLHTHTQTGVATHCRGACPREARLGRRPAKARAVAPPPASSRSTRSASSAAAHSIQQRLVSSRRCLCFGVKADTASHLPQRRRQRNRPSTAFSAPPGPWPPGGGDPLLAAKRHGHCHRRHSAPIAHTATPPPPASTSGSSRGWSEVRRARALCTAWSTTQRSGIASAWLLRRRAQPARRGRATTPIYRRGRLDGMRKESEIYI
jgi:hypothetical protein